MSWATYVITQTTSTWIDLLKYFYWRLKIFIVWDAGSRVQGEVTGPIYSVYCHLKIILILIRCTLVRWESGERLPHGGMAWCCTVACSLGLCALIFVLIRKMLVSERSNSHHHGYICPYHHFTKMQITARVLNASDPFKYFIRNRRSGLIGYLLKLSKVRQTQNWVVQTDEKKCRRMTVVHF